MARKASFHTMSKAFLKSVKTWYRSSDVGDTFVLFTQDSKVEDLFCGASSGSEPSLFFSNYFFSLGFKPIQNDFQHDFARMTDKADSFVVLAKLQVDLQ